MTGGKENWRFSIGRYISVTVRDGAIGIGKWEVATVAYILSIALCEIRTLRRKERKNTGM